MSKGFGTLAFVVYLALGLYFINIAFDLISLPEISEGVIMWVNAIAGILLIFGGFHFLGKKKKRRYREEY